MSLLSFTKRFSHIFLSVLLVLSTSVCYTQTLQDVVYTSEDGLCSVSAVDRRRACVEGVKEFSFPAWNPRMPVLVVEVANHDQESSLWLLDDKGKFIRELKHSSGYIRPIWSHDGRYIYAISYNKKGVVARWTINGKKSEIHILGGSDAYEFQMLSVNPSGKRAAFLNRFQSVIVADVNLSNFQIIDTLHWGFSHISNVVWVDDDHLIVIGKTKNDLKQLWKVDISNKYTQKLDVHGLLLRDQVVISPNHQYLAITAMSNNTNTGVWCIWKYSLKDLSITQLTDGSEDIVSSWR